MRLLPLALIVSATSLFAQQSRDPFPADFTPSPCAPVGSCRTFSDSELVSAAFKFYGLQLDMKWVLAHRDTVLKGLEMACQRHATCLATPGNIFWFCDDVLAAEARPVCDKLFPGDEQCAVFRETYLLGIDIKAKAVWDEATACASKLPAVAHSKPLDFWMTPSTLPVGFSGKVKFYALDPDTHVPILAGITFENQSVLAPANPFGSPASFYPFDYKLRYNRVPNADGHTDVVPPMITVTAPAYPTGASGPSYPVTKFRLPAEVPKMIVEMEPAPDQLRRGKNVVTIHAHDAATGKPVEARVMLGDEAVGDTNQPITLELPRKGRHAEIWVTSLFDKYSDVVIAKAR